MRERGEPQARAPPPSNMLPPPQPPRRGKERRDRNTEIEGRLEWLMKELTSLKNDIKEGTKRSNKRDRYEDYPALTRQRSRSRGERNNNTIREVTWSVVAAKGNTDRTTKSGQLDRTQELNQAAPRQPGRQQKRQQKPMVAKKDAVTTSGNKKRKVPKTAAVILTCPPGQYDETMKEARSKIDLAQCGVEKGKGPSIKRALTGALTFEFGGPNGQAQADKVADKLRELFNNKEGIRVSRPIKMAELRVRDLEDSIKPDEIKYVITQEGDCHHEEVKVGQVRRGNNGLGVAWIQCPVNAANKIIEKGRIQIGWTSARITLLEPRPLQCFRCLEGGHVRSQCKSNIDRSQRCYRCGKEGHKAQKCEDTPRCPVCADLGRPAGHRAGNKACTSARMKSRAGLRDKNTEGATQERTQMAETMISKEKSMITDKGETNAVEIMDMTEQPKPQRVRSKLPRLRDVELVDRSVEEIQSQPRQHQQEEEMSQDIRDRAQRAVKARKSCGKTARRQSDSEEEGKTCEPEDSRHEDRQE